MQQNALFLAESQGFAGGFRYQPELLSCAQASQLLAQIRSLPLQPAEYRQFLAKRRIVSYGGRYDYTAQRLQATLPMPSFLAPVRAELAEWAGCPAEEFTHALIAEYEPGVQLGWHRDVPDFECVVAVSLASPCRMRFRHYPPVSRQRVCEIELQPRSVYVLRDEARWHWQRSVPAVSTLRYSITFRTLRRPPDNGVGAQ